MKTRSIVALVAVAGMASMAAAQTGTVNWSWENTRTGGQDPLAPGDSALIMLGVEFTPAVGQSILTNAGEGTVGGFGALNMSVTGSGGTDGSWGDVARTAPWALGEFVAEPNGNVSRWEAGGFFFPNLPHPNPANPVPNVTQAVWTPDDYSEREVTFTGARVGTGFSIAGQLSSGNWSTHQVESPNFGSVRIPVIPSPASLALLGIGGLVAARRRR